MPSVCCQPTSFVSLNFAYTGELSIFRGLWDGTLSRRLDVALAWNASTVYIEVFYVASGCLCYGFAVDLMRMYSELSIGCLRGLKVNSDTLRLDFSAHHLQMRIFITKSHSSPAAVRFPHSCDIGPSFPAL